MDYSTLLLFAITVLPLVCTLDLTCCLSLHKRSREGGEERCVPMPA